MKSFLIFIYFFWMIIDFSNANWGTPGSSQYHIQTDEGPERFFRYQTESGQFRKERRLQDGTVIGTNAWIDGVGYLRMNDYIADGKGYRILKSKTVFVGNLPIEEAMKMAKKNPPASGILVSSTQSPPPAVSYTTTQTPFKTNSPGYYYHNPPANVIIHPHSQPRDNYLPSTYRNDLSTNDILNLKAPSIYYQPPLETSSNVEEKHSLPPIVVLPTPGQDYQSSSTTVSPPSIPRVQDETHLPPIAYYPSSTTVKPLLKDESHLPPIAYYPSSTFNPIDSNSVIPLSSTLAPVTIKPLTNEILPPKNYDVVSITSKPRIRYRPSSYQQSKTDDYDRNAIEPAASYASPTYQKHLNQEVPFFDRSKYLQQQQHQQQQKFPYYDGVGVTANGFRYFLPRQYQEEVSNESEDSRDGSFGYIDPFGIRRVVYYNAGRNGFVHRKNNRYVGFNSTPYDSRPK